jgi:transcriptional regulator with XRE-family HTH domain
MSNFAKSLNKLRLAYPLSMQALAVKANVSKSMISKIERNEVQPTLDVAGRLAKALEKTLSEMLHEAMPANVCFLPQAEQAFWQDADYITRRNISPIFNNLTMEWLEIELPVNTDIQKCQTQQHYKKCFLVKQGLLTIEVEQQAYQLRPGDSLYFEGGCQHVVKNSADIPTIVYVVIIHQRDKQN